ncbi:MAG TPA: metallopeptidase TldD-related protein [Burkholderiales bacterium]|nr:metallopeptidase TldD-related protein [Burkholderiales bacterium]
MKEAFFELSERLARDLRAGEVLLCGFAGERSDFVRFNLGKVRQAGSVEQRSLTLRLVRGRTQASASVELAGTSQDAELLRGVLARVRDCLDGLTDDPWLLINETPQSAITERPGALAPAQAVMEQAVAAATGRDLVGIYAGGTTYRGFANSLGQRNWHAVDSFNFDWSLYLQADQAAKSGYAGFSWEADAFRHKLDAAGGQLELLKLPARAVEPGEYRAYLAPRALEELTGLLSWGGFSARARATRQSPLLRMQEGAGLSEKVTLTENTAEGVAPGFQGDGFPKPPSVTLIASGRLGDALVSPRSAKEYGLATNGAGGGESPDALDLAPGHLEERDILAALDTGLYISNLWYLNFSDRPAGRITGMTRFATFWVERGRIAGPVRPMRFDDSIYRMLGDNLLDLTRERDLLLDPSTYGGRSTASSRLPGALLSSLRFTL